MPFLETQAAQAASLPTEPLTDPFHQLVQDLSDALGPSSGLDSDDVDPLDIQRLMKGYVSNGADWARYALADPSRAYTRNLVDEGNGKSNLVITPIPIKSWPVANLDHQLVLVWSPGKSSPIHDHANAHCVMKVRSSCCSSSFEIVRPRLITRDVQIADPEGFAERNPVHVAREGKGSQRRRLPAHDHEREGIW